MPLFSSTNARLTDLFRSSPVVEFDDTDKFVIFSDCHRGDGSWKDDYAHNRNLHLHALSYYFERDYRYVELGDSDELFENKHFDRIRYTHSNIFRQMKQFHDKQRLYLVHGNHDIQRRSPKVVEEQLYQFYNDYEGAFEPLFPGIQVHEGIVLRHKKTGQSLFLVHGHQGDLVNDHLWRLALILVRYVWAPLQFLGWRDPTMPQSPQSKPGKVERRISEWVDRYQQMVICGHTHRSWFPKPSATPYFNAGSCIHPRCITGLELEDGMISLVKWAITVKRDQVTGDGTLCITRELLADGPMPLQAIKYAV